MFRGSVPVHVQQIIAETVKDWSVSDVYVGCSGNFTIERALASVGAFRLHGNDVTLYSSCLGAYLAGQPFRIAVKEGSIVEDLVKPYMGSPIGDMACVMLMTQVAPWIDSQGKLRENSFYERMFREFSAQFPQLFEATLKKIGEVQFRLASYHCGDVVPWIEQLPKDKPLIVYPPFGGVGAAAQYARDTAKLETIFDWDKPTFTELDGDERVEFFAKVADRQFWAFGTNRPLEGFNRYLTGYTKGTNRGTIVHMYHSGGHKRVVMPEQKLLLVNNQRLEPGMVLGNHMTLAPLRYDQFQALRSQYMNIGIRPGAATLAVGVLVDGLLVGVYAFSSSIGGKSMADISRVYLLSDFPVRPTSYPKLAKLVLYAALSKESQMLAQRMVNRRLRHVLTTAYSNNPQSMKYRGLFKLHSRRANPTLQRDWGATIDVSANTYYARKYELNYLADLGEWTCDEGLALWKKKFGDMSDADLYLED